MNLLISNNYLVRFAYIYFYYEDATQINELKPKEGFIAGGNSVKIIGNFSLFWDKDFDLYFGLVKMTTFIQKSETVIEVYAPPVTVP